MASTVDRSASSNFYRPLLVSAGLILLGYMGLFAILQSPVLWYALRPDPIRSLIPDLFAPVNSIFPDAWVNLKQTGQLALLVVPLYLGVLALVTGPLIYLVRRFAGKRTGEVLRPRQVSMFLIIVFAATIAIMVILLFARGILSTDIYSYAWYSRILAVHGASPMTHAPQEFPPDPEGAFYWIGWPDEPSVYGPVWVIVSTAFFQVGNSLAGTFSAQLLSLRVLADLAHLINAWLVWLIAGLISAGGTADRSGFRLFWRAARTVSRDAPDVAPSAQVDDRRRNGLGLRMAALLLYIWNPLLLIEFVESGHNDVLMITFVLAAIWLHLTGRWPLAAIALALAVLVKLPAVLLVPGYLWYLFWSSYDSASSESRLRRASRAVVQPLRALMLTAVTAALLYLPFWEGPRTLLPPLTGPANRLYLHTLAYDIWWNGPQLLANSFSISSGRAEFMASARDFLNANLRTLFNVALGIVAIALTWKANTFPRLLVSWGWVALVAAILQGWYWPWYASWSIAIAAVASSSRLRIATLVFTVSSLLIYVEEQVLAHHFPLFLDWSGVFVMLPPLLYVLVSWFAERRRRATAQLSRRGVGGTTNTIPSRFGR